MHVYDNIHKETLGELVVFGVAKEHIFCIVS